MQPGIVNRDLDKLTNEELFRVARDRRAADRVEAVRILVHRCSAFIRRREIADEEEALLATTPARTE